LILLDSNALLWWLADDPRLGADARHVIETSHLVLSPASLWEIAIKSAKRNLPIDLGRTIAFAHDAGIARLAISDAHLLQVQALPHEGHADPFDRMIIAQALTERIPILTSDRQFTRYGVDVIDARR
jgi:PIN domain nuclease of toxin-antitoxin system